MTQQSEFEPPAPVTAAFPENKTRTMLLMLAELGLDRGMIAGFLDASGYSKEHIAYVLGPVVQHRSSWQDTTPPWMYHAVFPERLETVLEEHAQGHKSGWRAGPCEIAAVMYPAVMEAPLAYEAAQLYLWACASASAKHYNRPAGQIWEEIGGGVVSDKDVIAEGGQYFYEYQRLSGEIRRKVIRAGRQRDRACPAKAPCPAPACGIAAEQFDLFAGDGS